MAKRSVAILLGALALLAAASFWYAFMSDKGPATSEPTACTLEAKLCPDGSSVGRTGPDCAFAPCPGEAMPPSGDEEEGVDVLAAYFAAEVTARATARSGAMPIEGYDADLLLGAYPGLTAEDFDGVAAFEGIYIYEDGALAFERTQEEPVSSAERTIAAEGYATLLINVSARLDAPLVLRADVDALITKLETR